jgi:hypothetical protein
MAARPADIGRGTRDAASDPTITARLKGAKRSPFPLWTESTARNIAGEVVPVSASATSDPRASPGSRSEPGGSSGCGERCWTRAKAASSAAPAASGNTLVRLRPSRTAASPSVKVSAPGTSSPPGPSPRDSGSTRPASPAPASPIGTLTANTHSQPGPLLISPPSTQPEAPPPAAAAVQMASARGRGSEATSRASADGATSAAPVPWTARAATSAAAEGASAHASDAAANTSSPARNARRRPERSATRPASRSPPPKVSV